MLALGHIGCAMASAQTSALPASAQTSALPASVAQALTHENIPHTAVSARVDKIDFAPDARSTPAPALLRFRDEVAMNPASVMKLATAYGGLRLLGPTHTWTTQVALSAWPHNNTVQGSVYLIGSGDPVLSYERLANLLRQVRALGVRHIEGDIVLDDSAWSLPSFDPGAFDGQAMRPYNAGASALLMNFNALRLGFVPHPVENHLHVLPEPALAGLSLGSGPVLSSGACGRFQRELKPRLEPTALGMRLHIEGPYPRACGHREFHVAPWSIPLFNRALIQALWKEVGGTLGGEVRQGKTPSTALPAVSSASPPLADVVRDMNKWSNNVQARQILATLGAHHPLPDTAKAPAVPDTLTQGAHTLARFLADEGLPTQGLHIENGAGLSRSERMSARLLTALLVRAWHSEIMPEFLASLPTAGVDGTARRRLSDSRARAQARIKTGTLNEVSAMAGYVRDAKGQWWAVAMMVNHPRAQASQAAQDALIEWVFSGNK